MISLRCLNASVALRRTSAVPHRQVLMRAVRQETPEQAEQRRLRETERYNERVEFVNDVKQLEAQIKAAGDKLVVVEVQSEAVCQTDMEGDSEQEKDAIRNQWGGVKVDVHSEAMQKCRQIKHTFQRIARDASDAVFLEHTVDEEPTKESMELCNKLNIDILPTLQFWKNGQLIFEHKGAQNMETDMAEGVLYLDGAMANGVKGQSFVRDLNSREDFSAFISSAPDDQILRVVVMAQNKSSACMHLYPAVVALAQNFKGYAAFGRIMVDAKATQPIAAELKVVECPTFVLFRGGKEVGRQVGASRVDLIGKIMQVQGAAGIAPPSKPGTGRKVVRKV